MILTREVSGIRVGQVLQMICVTTDQDEFHPTAEQRSMYLVLQNCTHWYNKLVDLFQVFLRQKDSCSWCWMSGEATNYTSGILQLFIAFGDSW